VTSGDELTNLGRFLPPGGELAYTASDVIAKLQESAPDSLY
jgi:hypothetical protein